MTPAKKRATRKNSAKNSGPVRDARGRLRGGNPGNSGGKKGRSGRPPREFRALVSEIVRSEKFQSALEEAACDNTHASYRHASTLVVEYAEGKPTLPVEHSATDSFVALVAAAYRGSRE